MVSEKNNDAVEGDASKSGGGRDYSETLNLPRSDFPMRGSLPQQEPLWLDFWERIDLWEKLRSRSRAEGREKYILHDGPPYANGHLHIGHALNKILKDIISRSRQMLGYDSHYVPGWDCHGLPIEWKIEERYRERGLDKDAVDILEFRKQCRDFATEWVDIQRREFKRLGVMGDWESPYLTMSYDAEASIAREFCKFLMNGSLFCGEKPVLWSIVEKTALAEAEVEYKDYKSVSVYVAFRIAACSNKSYEGIYIPIWTTTVWTVPCNRALAFSDKVSYGLYEVTETSEACGFVVGDRFLFADSLLAAFTALSGIAARRVGDVSATDLQGVIAHHPLHSLGFKHDVPLHCGDFVDDSQGTGFVHTAPSHGDDDYFFALRYGVEDYVFTVTEDGCYSPHIPYFSGLTIYTSDGADGEATGAVLRALKESGGLLAKHSFRHSYPHSWRSKAPLIYRSTSQWFIGMEKNALREKALKAIEATMFYPVQGRSRLYDMIENRPNWCISRQRAWGVPLTLFVHKETREPLRDAAVNERIYTIFKAEGADAWFSRAKRDFLGEAYDADDYEQVFDVLDVWFDSGSTHSFVLEERGDLKWPADLYLEGSDQHRGWFHSSLLEACGTRGRAPYDAVLTHGFVLAEDGQKMSKSLGNITTPQSVHDELGADILRLWVVASNYYEELSIGPKTLKQHSDSYRRFRNTWRYLLGNLSDFDPHKDKCSYEDLDILDKWVLHRLFELDGIVKEACRNYDFHRIFRDLHNFCANDLSSLYFDIRKDRLYCERKDSVKRRATQTVLHEVFHCLTLWLAPILCFTAEEVWQSRREALDNSDSMAESVHLCDFPEVDKVWKNKEIVNKLGSVWEFRSYILRNLEEARWKKMIGSSLQACLTVSTTDKDLFKAWNELQELDGLNLADIFIASNFDLQFIDVESDKRLQEAMKFMRASTDTVVALANGRKCERCWKISAEVVSRGGLGGEPICDRCHSVLHEE